MGKLLSLQKKIMLAVFSLMLAVSAVFGVLSLKTETVKAEGTFSMVKGASLSLGEHYGLRFAAKIGDDYSKDNEYRMLIVPVELIEKYNITGDWYNSLRKALNDDGLASQELVNPLMYPIQWVGESDEFFTNGESYFFGSITDIKYHNITRNFFAVAYYIDEAGVFHYAEFDENANVMNPFYIASKFKGVYSGTAAEKVDTLIRRGINYANGLSEEYRDNAYNLNLTVNGADAVASGTSTYTITGMPNVDAYAVWSTSDSTIATINQQGELTVVGSGEVDVMYKVLGETFTKTVEINMPHKEKVNMTASYGLKQSDDSGNIVSPDFTVEVEGTLESATIDGAVVEASQDGNVVTILASTLNSFSGKAISVVIITDTHKYTISLKVADFLVTKASDLIGARTTANPMMQALGCSDSTGKTTGYNWGGYVLLAGDIDFGGATVYFGGAPYNGGASVNYGFSGTIDGNGYALKNFTFGGSGGGWSAMFGNFRAGTIKDLSILNAKQQFVNNEGLLFLKAVATLENCYFDIEAGGTGGGFILCREDRNNRLIIRNSVFIVRTGARETSKSALIGTYTSNQVSNTVVFSDYAEATGLQTALGDKFVGYADNKLEVNVSAGADAVVGVANATRVLKDGKDITSLVICGENSIIIPNAILDEASTYVVIGDTSKIVNFKLAKYQVSTSKTYGAKQSDDSGNIISPDFTVEVEGTLKSATIDGVEVTASQEGRVVKIPASAFCNASGKVANTNPVVKVDTNSHEYTITARVVDFLVTKASDLIGGRTTANPMMKALGCTDSTGKTTGYNWGGYVLLANDIDFGGATVYFGGAPYNGGASVNYGFSGTIDGNGYALKNFTFGGSGGGWSAMFGNFKSGTIKNLLILEARQQYVNNEGLLFRKAVGTIDNCYFDIKADGTGSGYILAQEDSNLTIKNTIIIVRTGARPTTSSALISTYTHTAPGTIVFSDYADAEGLKTAADKFVGYTDNKLEVSVFIGNDAKVEVANATRVLKDGKDITELDGVDCGAEYVTISSSLLNETSTYVVISGAEAKIVNFVFAKQQVSMSGTYAIKQTNDAGEIITSDYSVEVIGELESATINGVAVEASQEGNIVTIPASAFCNASGKVANTNSVVKVFTNSHEYTIGLKAVDFLITKASDLNSGRTTPNKMMVALGCTDNTGKSSGYNWSGYVLLANDIDFGGAMVFTGAVAEYASASYSYGFTGTIDGNGYALKNFTFGGSGGGWSCIFGNFLNGTIKNLSIVDAVQPGTNSEGLLIRKATATIENCYIDVVVNGGIILGNSDKNLVIKNSVIIARTGNKATTSAAIIGSFTHTAPGTVIFSDYAEVDGLKTAADKFVGYTESKLETRVLEGADAVVEVANVTRVLKDGKDITADVTITASSVTIPNGVWDETSTFVVIGDTAKIVNVVIGKQQVATSKSYGLKQTNDASEVITPDFTVEVEGALESATINGVAVEASQEGNVVTIPSSLFTASASSTTSVALATDTHEYAISVKVANFLITKASDLIGGRTTANPMMKALGCSDSTGKTTGYNWGGYVLLANDIDFGGATVYFGGAPYNGGASVNYGFQGTIDGNGYALKNFTFGGSGGGWSAMFGNFRSGTIKDLSILNAKQQFVNNEGILFRKAVATLENCYFDIEAAGNGGGYILCGEDRDNKLIIRNSVFIVRTGARDTSKSALIATYTSNQVSNTVVFSDYAEATGLQTALGDKFVGYADNKLEVNVSAGADAVVGVANATRVLKDGKDITSLVTIGENVTIPSDLVDANSTYVVIGATSKIVNLVIA